MTEFLPTESLLSFEAGGRVFDIHKDAPDHLADSLIEKSKQDHILRWTPHDAESRFADRKSLAAHINKGRHMYMLANNTDLAGVIWYGNKQFPDPEFGPQPANQTFAIRIYEGYLRQGLAAPFMDCSLRDYLWSFVETPRKDSFEGLWLSTHADNSASALYLRYGYRIVGQADGLIFMVLSDSKIREIVGA